MYVISGRSEGGGGRYYEAGGGERKTDCNRYCAASNAPNQLILQAARACETGCGRRLVGLPPVGTEVTLRALGCDHAATFREGCAELNRQTTTLTGRFGVLRAYRPSRRRVYGA